MQTELLIQGSEIRTSTPEGVEARMPLADLFDKLIGYRNDVRATVLPDGIKAVFERGPVTIWVHEIPPCVRLLKWIAADSEQMFGEGTKYRDVAVALPYVIVLAVFAPGERGRLTLASSCEAFFRNRPLGGPGDELLFPALLNCSKFEPQEGHPLAWICTQHLDRSFDLEEDPGRRLRLGFKALLSCLFDTGFNYSSEHHEGSSWFTESRGVDPRVSSIEAWQQATAADPLFAVEVPWLPTHMSLAGVAERILDNLGAGWPAVDSAGALARFVINHAADSGPAAGPQTEPQPKPQPMSSMQMLIEQLGIF